MPVYRLSDLAKRVGGTLHGEDLLISGLNALSLATEEELSFIDSRRHLEEAKISRAKALIAPSSLADDLPGKSLLLVSNVRAAMARLAWLFYEEESPPKGISPLAFLEDGVEIHPEASVYPFVYISKGARIARGVVLYPGVYVGRGAEIGEETIVYPNVVIYARTKIAPRVIIHAGVVVGSDGFGYAQEGDKHLKIPHFGRVEIEEGVEIGANSAVDRATFGLTRIGAGSKIDNLVQIGHNVILGQGCVLAGQVGVAGSAQLGNLVMVGGQAGIGQVKIGDLAMIAAKAGVAKDVPPRGKVAGAPAMEAHRWRRCVTAYEQLPELIREIRELRQKLAKLEKEFTDGKSGL